MRISMSAHQTYASKYKGADEAYAKLLGKLADRQFAGMQAGASPEYPCVL